MVRRAFPDLVFTPDLVLSDGEYVAGRWTMTGTNTGGLDEAQGDGLIGDGLIGDGSRGEGPVLRRSVARVPVAGSFMLGAQL